MKENEKHLRPSGVLLFQNPKRKEGVAVFLFLKLPEKKKSDKQIVKMRRMLRKCCLLLFSARVSVRPWVKKQVNINMLELPLTGLLMLVFDPGFPMWWAARIRNLREKPSPVVLGNVSKCLESVQSYAESLAESLAEGLVKRALAGLGKAQARDGSSRRPGTSS